MHSYRGTEKRDVDVVNEAAPARQLRGSLVLILGTGLGLLGLFGLAHLYVGLRWRGLAFLSCTAILYGMAVLSLFRQGLPIPLPVIWGIGWVVQEFDLHCMRRGWELNHGIRG